MDGNFPSIFPIDDEFNSLSDVEFTPFFKSYSYDQAYISLEQINNNKVNDLKTKMESLLPYNSFVILESPVRRSTSLRVIDSW